MSNSGFKNVSRQNPCPICGKTDWCSISKDGVWCCCRRVDTGEGLHKIDAAGVDYWLYRLDGRPFQHQEPDNPETFRPVLSSDDSEPERADPDTLHRVYTALLDELTLCENHRENLHKRGLNDDEIAFRGYKSLNKNRSQTAKKLIDKFGPEVCTKVPGLFKKANRKGEYWTISGPNGIIIPVRDSRHRIVALKVRADEPVGGNKYLYVTSRRRNDALWDGPGPGTPVHIALAREVNSDVIRLTEGELKADIATALNCILTIAIPGVSVWRPALPVIKELGAKTVRLAFDADARNNKHVARALKMTAEALKKEGFNVELETWPLERGKGIDDILAAGYQPEVLSGQEAFKEVNSITKAAGVEPERIPINAGIQDLGFLMKKSWEALDKYRQQKEPLVFVRSGALTRVKIDKKDGPILDIMSEAALKNTLDKVAYWYRMDKNGQEKSAFPVTECVKGMLAEASPPVPRLLRIVQAPVFGRDGTLITSPGYHEKAETWYHKTCDIPEVPEKPTKDDLVEAYRLLFYELLVDFPFDDESSMAYALAAMLQPFVRAMIDGPTPLHVIDAKSGSGTGKSLLADMIAMPALGRPIPAMAEGRDGDEWRKRITAKLATGSQFVLIDNVNRKLDSGELAAAITSTVWEDRLLGSTRMIQLPVECCWLATGNAVRTSREMARRIVKIKLDAKRDDPWMRTDFKHPNIREWAAKNRGQLIWACLVLIQAWIAEGKPLGKQTLGMFESWAKVMGGILSIIEMPGFLENLQEIYAEADEETFMWREFISAWWERYHVQAVGVAELYDLAIRKDLLMPVLGDKGERSQKTRLGRALSRINGRYFGKFRVVETVGDARNRTKAYMLECDEHPF
jgi:hypothetical protein